MIKLLLFASVVLSTAVSSSAQLIDRVEPPFWWAGMSNSQLQLMIHGESISDYSFEMEAEGILLKQTTKLENPNYVVLDLVVDDNLKPGFVPIYLKKGKRIAETIQYELKQREVGSRDRIGFNTSDVMYLITPDRFANGDPSNDFVNGMKERPNREAPGGRHGGDIKGISNNLDYIKNLGFTAIWVNPVLENNMEEYSYHGYSTTDFYKVDPRFGSNEEYKALVNEAHSSDIKVIMDMIVNHCGSFHWWMDDLPASDWFNHQSEYLIENQYQNTSHRKSVIQDPYVSQSDLEVFTDGWFVPTMPDLNQRNPIMANYLIQNSIWWIEYSGIDGIRMDTYPYPDKDFMTDWTCAVQNEYPNFNTVGEEWYEEPEIVAFWQQGKQNPNGYTSCLPSLMDFPLQANLTKGLNGEDGGFSGWVDTYTTLASDFLYTDPYNLVTFPDNHDMSRFFTQVNEDFDLFKLGITYILTVRGIPQIYYGSEILMKNPGTTDHGIIRSDFPGGWEGDEVNAFKNSGLTNQQIESMDFFRKILTWRKSQPVIHDGKLMHYNPENGIYVLFRFNESDKVMIILSKNHEETDLKLDRFYEMIEGNESGVEILSGKTLKLGESLSVPARSAMIIDFY